MLRDGNFIHINVVYIDNIGFFLPLCKFSINMHLLENCTLYANYLTAHN